MEGDNIEHKEFWERVEKIKKDFGIDISNTNRALEAKILDFRYKLIKELGYSEYKYILEMYDKQFNIETHRKGIIKANGLKITEGKFTLESLGLTTTHCRECGSHLDECKCTDKTIEGIKQ